MDFQVINSLFDVSYIFNLMQPIEQEKKKRKEKEYVVKAYYNRIRMIMNGM